VHPVLLRRQATISFTRKSGESAVIRNRNEMNGSPLLDHLGGQKTLYESFWKSVDEWNQNYFVRDRVTYSELGQRVIHFGSGLSGLGLAASDILSPTQFVGVFLSNSIEWVIADAAMFSFGFVSVPIPFSVNEEAPKFVFDETQLRVVITQNSKLSNFLLQTSKYPLLTTIIIAGMEKIDESTSVTAKELGISLYSFKEVERYFKLI
jgi:long-subunit acyl-CoA synthetase (AMP-forming)